MINYMINFIQEHIIIILAVLSSLVFLSLASKRFRRFMYGGVAAGSLSLVFAIMYKCGYGFETFYEYFSKVIYSVTRGIEEAQNLLASSKTLFQALVVSLDSDQLVKSLYLNDTFYSFTVELILVDFCNLIDEIKIKVLEIIEIIQDKFNVTKTNRSRLTFVYRC